VRCRRSRFVSYLWRRASNRSHRSSVIRPQRARRASIASRRCPLAAAVDARRAR
jgi:hypothetical protein